MTPRQAKEQNTPTLDSRFREAEIEAKKAEAEVSKAELLIKQKELKASPWLNPIVAAILAATLAAIGNGVITMVTGYNQITLEDRKAEQSRILEMIKTGDPDKAAVNLDFLLRAGLISDSTTAEKLRSYLDERNPGEGASLASSETSPDQSTALARFWKILDIPVCWENPTEDNEKYRSLVQRTISATWSAHSRVKFIGWDTCAAASDQVRIYIADEPPNTKAIGQLLRGLKQGVVLNFQFESWGPQCKTTLEYCITATSVHVFGHVLGFEHEQNRPDAPAECAEMTQGNADVFIFGPYDPDSVMNYCNPKWMNDGVLSNGDIAKVQMIYGLPESSP